MQQDSHMHQAIEQLFRNILDESLSDICKSSTQIPNKPLPQLIKHTYYPCLNVYQAQAYQQYTDNLCGYHATYNTLCFLNLLRKGQTTYSILSGASFWSFKRKIQVFLMGVKERNNYKEWPWKNEDILYGDFQRSYNTVCLEQFQDFQIFRDQTHFHSYSFTWEFQFKNLLLTEEKRRELDQCFVYFQNYMEERPLIISFMLGITDHWMAFFALKVKGQPQYWLFDSGNLKFIGMNDVQIDEYVQQLQRQRIELKGEGFKQFDKKNMSVFMRDTQISLGLLIDCLQGRSTLEKYSYNQQFCVFALKMDGHWQDSVRVEKVVKDYWYNIGTFFQDTIQYHLLSQDNLARLDKLINAVNEFKQLQQCSQLYELLTIFGHL